ncbi:MAG: aminoacyl-tRNA hydrolase [Flavobacteriales bacterium]|nr:aminoacyl-tRNA hydrolase [Flavobacteriia bacterium]NCP05507.1 aminoacyl-tRNA hydrolase [Flavobacteriales bacterium]PIV92424.1 MAG: aminoacyl-tRNA hydrolase [Flavobacteriaceae bacterium CG17_big_fil_post_rev_8_21_14_2_50_33_15]PIY11834.1 MAG: aminoacyl-tRNA hydrolase [Flavobacteriaceae bacterium CG_4_10_14_3_um_filter_33_47]PJB16774.1 MAG: aminoacyl-tRNA hydrolase [Flavobacteriaceae bacterium CG_4_9_14_3_um_filter_33_16]
MNREALIAEINFKATRSSGSGGQHVNKVASKIELVFNIPESLFLNDEEKERLINKLSSRLTKENVLILQCDESRSQYKNKELAIERFINIIKEGLKVKKKRVPTKIPLRVIKKRIKDKRNLSDKKSIRKKPDLE